MKKPANNAHLSRALAGALALFPTSVIFPALLSAHFASTVARADDPVAADKDSWERWAQSDRAEGTPSVQHREVSKSGRFQLLLPMIGMSSRQDFHSTLVLSGAVRFHFSERSAWEILRVDYSRSTETGLAQEIREKTTYRPDVQVSRYQVGSAFVFSPIYGKYAWNESSIVYFDIFGRAGAGIRFANDRQPFAELGLGMNHYLLWRRIALVPEIRWRFYSEQRTSKVFVNEGLMHLGVAWLL